MRSIYRFYVYCGRHGSLEGKFTAEQVDIEFAIGKTIYFYEPWGKHTGVEVTLEPDMFGVISSDPGAVEIFDGLELRAGNCPLGILRDSIWDGSIELTEDEKRSAPPYFQTAIRRGSQP